MQTMFWHHLDPPRVIVYIHYVCDMDKPHVQAGLTACHNMMDSVNQGHLGPMSSFPPPKPPGVVFPLAGSCACCERDATAADSTEMKKCSRCKLTRYAWPSTNVLREVWTELGCVSRYCRCVGSRSTPLT